MYGFPKHIYHESFDGGRKIANSFLEEEQIKNEINSFDNPRIIEIPPIKERVLPKAPAKKAKPKAKGKAKPKAKGKVKTQNLLFTI